MNRLFLFVFVVLLFKVAYAAESKKQVRYSKGKDVDFESLLIEGQIKRPDISIVTGNKNESISGLLKLREDFIDEIAMEVGEEME